MWTNQVEIYCSEYGIIAKEDKPRRDTICYDSRLNYRTTHFTIQGMFLGKAFELTASEKIKMLRDRGYDPRQQSMDRIMLSDEDQILYKNEHQKMMLKYEYIICGHTLNILPRTISAAWFDTDFAVNVQNKMISRNTRIACLYVWREFGHRDCMDYIMSILLDIVRFDLVFI